MKISVDVEELVNALQGNAYHTFQVSRDDYKKICDFHGISSSEFRAWLNNVVFTPGPSITAELDRLLAQRDGADIRAKFIMSDDVYRQYVKECDEDAVAKNQYKGVCITKRPYVEGGVQLWYESFVKGNL